MTGMAFINNIFEFVPDLIHLAREFVDNNPWASVFKHEFVDSAFWFIALNSLAAKDCITYMILLGIWAQRVNEFLCDMPYICLSTLWPPCRMRQVTQPAC